MPPRINLAILASQLHDQYGGAIQIIFDESDDAFKEIKGLPDADTRRIDVAFTDQCLAEAEIGKVTLTACEKRFSVAAGS